MASIDYEEIFSSFLGNITDYNIASMNSTDAFELMTEYLHKTIADPYVKHIFSDVSLDDETQVLSYTLVRDTNDKDFVINALSKWMVYEWYAGKVNNIQNITQFFGNKETKWLSQAAHSAENRSLRDTAYKEARFYIQNRGYIDNSYLGGV